MILSKQRFYLSLVATYLKLNNPACTILSKKISNLIDFKKNKLKIFFWIPENTSGSRIIVEDIYSDLVKALNDNYLDWDVSISRTLPSSVVDYLICFKAIPDIKIISGSPKLIMLICDQAEIFWDDLPKFDALIATSSIAFAKLIANKNKNVYFIGESESHKNIAIGGENLATPPSSRPPNLMWHGGEYSLKSLYDLRPVLEDFASRHNVNLQIVSGNTLPQQYQWGKLNVTHLPWSINTILETAKKSRLGIIPSRGALRTSFLKPASRVRCLYALGVPAIGDQRVPDVVDFMSEFKGPMAKTHDEWLYSIEKIWNSKDIDSLAQKGWNVVDKKYSSKHTANQWINFIIAME